VHTAGVGQPRFPALSKRSYLAGFQLHITCTISPRTESEERPTLCEEKPYKNASPSFDLMPSRTLSQAPNELYRLISVSDGALA
jgi:hypothetical protein